MPTSEQTITLKTWDGHYVTAEDGGGHEGDTVPTGPHQARPKGLLRARGTDADLGDWQWFTVRPAADGKRVGFRGANGCWVSAELNGTLVCNRQRPDDFVPEAWEAFEPVDLGDGKIALKTAHGKFVCAEGGGGDILVGNRDSAGPWETFEPSAPLFGRVPASGTLRRIVGQVRGANHCLVDDGGPILVVGLTLMPAANRFKFDRAQLEANLAKVAGRVHYIRTFAAVGPSGGWDDRVVDPRWADWADILQATTDLAFDTYGILLQWDIFGGIDAAPTPFDRETVVRRFCAALADRQQKIILVQVANEAYKNGFDPDRGGATEVLQLARLVRQLLPNVLVATTDAADTQGGDPYYDGDVATVRTLHPDRSQNGSGGIWRPVRQTWDYPTRPALKWIDEPIGPKSSVAMDADPRRVSMLAGGGYVNGCPAFTLHTGAGVRLGGAADQGTGKFYLPRERNVYEAENFDAILDAIVRMATKLPADIGNWQHLNANHNFPAYPFNVDLLPEDKILRAYCATDGSRFVIAAMDVQADVPFEARRPLSVQVFDSLTWDQVDSRDLAAGEAITVRGAAGGTAWILMGTYR